jgi:hypothetical protein
MFRGEGYWHVDPVVLFVFMGSCTLVSQDQAQTKVLAGLVVSSQTVKHVIWGHSGDIKRGMYHPFPHCFGRFSM